LFSKTSKEQKELYKKVLLNCSNDDIKRITDQELLKKLYHNKNCYNSRHHLVEQMNEQNQDIIDSFRFAMEFTGWFVERRKNPYRIKEYCSQKYVDNKNNKIYEPGKIVICWKPIYSTAYFDNYTDKDRYININLTNALPVKYHPSDIFNAEYVITFTEIEDKSATTAGGGRADFVYTKLQYLLNIRLDKESTNETLDADITYADNSHFNLESYGNQLYKYSDSISLKIMRYLKQIDKRNHK